jgi:cytidylate kinase
MTIENKVPVITLDGPSGTGKGTITHLLAQYLKWHVLDSGSIYRVLALAARKQAINFKDINQLSILAMNLDLRFTTDTHQNQQVLLNNHNVIDEIRTEQCGQDASTIAVIPEIRASLLERQRGFATLPGLVTDGRDMGTVVFPNAYIKFYLYASPEERANRRYLQLQKSGNNVSLAEVIDELAKRDARDTSRTHAPLKPAENAVLIDTTGLTVIQVFDKVLDFVEKGGRMSGPHASI